MKTTNVKCPNCGAMLTIQDRQNLQFCEYCGNKLINEDNTTTTNINHRYIDEAEVIKVKTESELKIKQDERNQKELEERKKTNKILLLSWIASMALFLIISFFTMDEVNFSPFQLLLILDLIIGIVVIVKRSKKQS